MSESTRKPNVSYSDRISELGDRLHEHAGDEAMLSEIHVAIRTMLVESGENDAEIRAELQRRFEQGEIRPESFELVKEMLDRIGLEKTTKLDSPMPMDMPLDPDGGSAASVSVDFPPRSTTRLDASVPLDLPLEQTTKFTVPGPDATRPNVAATQDVPLNQTVKIAAPFPLDPDVEKSTLRDRQMEETLPRDQALLTGDDDDDQEFINTAVLDNQSPHDRSADDQLQVGSVLRDRFLLQEQLSGGSMGVVFKALDRRLAETGDPHPFVAIKVLSSALSRNANALRALQQEAAKGRFLSHPNIVRFIDLDREDSLYFIVMEWLEGRSLAQILDESTGKKVDLGMALNVVSQVGRALDYAHLRGVVHADVKPGNIIITPDGHVKLLDFGVARIRQKQVEGRSKFDPAVLGAASPAYSSMQVLTGEDPAPPDDVFSLGCLMYRMVAGIRVFGPRNAADAAAEGMEPQRPHGLNDTQWRALKKSLSYSRVTRFPTPKAFIDALGSGAATSAPTPTPVAEPAVKATKKPLSAQQPVAPGTPGQPAMRAVRNPLPDDTYVYDDFDKPRRSPWRLAVIGAILVASVAVVSQTSLVDYVDDLAGSDAIQAIIGTVSNDPVASTDSEVGASAVADDDGIIDAPADEESLLPDIVETNMADSDELLFDDDVPVEDEVLVADEFAEPDSGTETEVAQVAEIPAFDYADFSEPTIRITLAAGDEAVAGSELSVREGAAPAIVELVRSGDLSEEFSVSLAEVSFAGSRSPLQSGRYEIENKGVVSFAVGQERAQTSIALFSNNEHEPDTRVTLQAQGFADTDPVLAEINVTLEDDDLRKFEAGLAPNTVSFTVSEVTVRESDPAVHVDLVRYRVDNRPLDVEYVLTGITATEGEDYFTPGFTTVSFGPGERTARILLPLGQDSKTETNETFTFELLTSTPRSQTDILTRLTVIIRDDD